MNKAILPCAGYGTRMNMQLNKSKELLIDPITNEPIIKWHLDLCKENNIKPIIITRKEKTDLIEYTLKNTEAELIVLDNISGEWPSTVLKSKGMWGNKNILMLPDTRFNPHTKSLFDSLKNENYDLVFAIHRVDNISKWGAIDPLNNKFCEKPQEQFAGYAWGLISFSSEAGEETIDKMILRNHWWTENYYLVDYIHLNSFIDLTRTGTIERYE